MSTYHLIDTLLALKINNDVSKRQSLIFKAISLALDLGYDAGIYVDRYDSNTIVAQITLPNGKMIHWQVGIRTLLDDSVNSRSGEGVEMINEYCSQHLRVVNDNFIVSNNDTYIVFHQRMKKVQENFDILAKCSNIFRECEYAIIDEYGIYSRGFDRDLLKQEYKNAFMGQKICYMCTYFENGILKIDDQDAFY